MTSPETSTRLRDSHLPEQDQPATGLGLGAALAAWVALLVALNVTVQPIVSCAAFAGLCTLAWWAGQRRLIVLSLMVGAGLLLVMPGLSLTSGSWALTFGPTANWLPLATPMGIVAALMSLLRVPAQVLAITLLALVPATELLHGLARVSPRSALLGGLAARMRPLMRNDARLLRDELRSRGLIADRNGSLAARTRSLGLLWSSLIAGAFDRAEVTALTLSERGYGARRATTGPLQHVQLRPPQRSSQAVDRLVLVTAILVVSLAIFGRATGALRSPDIQVFAGIHDAATPLAVLLAVAVALLTLIPAWMLTGIGAELHRPVMLDQHARRSRLPARTGAEQFTSRLQVRAGGGTLRMNGLRVQVRRSGRVLLDVPSLEVGAGAFVVVVGRSGGGKSMLLDTLIGSTRERGDLVVTGAVEMAVSDGTLLGAEAQSGRIAMVRQDASGQSIFDLVSEDAAFALRNQCCAVDEIERRVLWALQAVACEHLGTRRCSELSGGELQRVMLAAALARRPDVLVLDEPTAELDELTARAFWNAVDVLRAQDGTTVIVAEHRTDGVRERADRWLVVDRGMIVADSDRDPAAFGGGLDTATVRHPVQVVPAWQAPPRVAIAIAGLSASKTNGVTLCAELNLLLPAGAVVAITGENGSGKSTLLRAMRGLHPVTGYTIVDGLMLGDVTMSTQQVTWLGQHAVSLVLADTVLDHARLSLPDIACNRSAAFAALLAAGLADRQHSHPNDLSVGERQRLAIVSATLHRPPLWLIDEPTRGMDDVARNWFCQLVSAHTANGGVVIIATHDRRLIRELASHQVHIAAGRAELARVMSERLPVVPGAPSKPAAQLKPVPRSDARQPGLARSGQTW